jgi:hypothetical protein
MDTTATRTPTAAQLALKEDDLFGADPSLQPPAAPAPPAGVAFEFTGTLLRNADVRSKPPKDGYHVVPVVCLELRNTNAAGPKYCYVERPYTDATRSQAEAFAKSLKKGTVVTVMAPETDLRVSVHHPLSIHPHEAQAV